MHLIQSKIPLELMTAPLDNFQCRDYRKSVAVDGAVKRVCVGCQRKLSLDTTKCQCGKIQSQPTPETKERRSHGPMTTVHAGTLCGRSTGRPHKLEGKAVAFKIAGKAKPSREKPIGRLPNGKPIYNLVS